MQRRRLHVGRCSVTTNWTDLSKRSIQSIAASLKNFSCAFQETVFWQHSTDNIACAYFIRWWETLQSVNLIITAMYFLYMTALPTPADIVGVQPECFSVLIFSAQVQVHIELVRNPTWHSANLIITVMYLENELITLNVYFKYATHVVSGFQLSSSTPLLIVMCNTAYATNFWRNYALCRLVIPLQTS